MTKIFKDRRILALYLFTVFAVLLYGSIIQRAVHKIDINTTEIMMSRYESCRNSVGILIKFNAQQRDLERIISLRQDISPMIRQQYIDTYERAIVEPLPSCEAERRKVVTTR